MGAAGSSPRRDSLTLLRIQWIYLGYCAPSAPCPGRTTGYIWRESPPLADRRRHARGRAERNRDESSLVGDLPSSCQIHLLPSFIWKGASGSFRNNSSLCWPINIPRTRRLSTGFSLPSRVTQKANMRRPPILHFPHLCPWRGGLCFFQRWIASNPSTPGPTPGMLNLRMRVRNYRI